MQSFASAARLEFAGGLPLSRSRAFMHIPDGYISPATAAVLYGAAAPFWCVAGRKVRALMGGQTVPLLALFSAFSFTVMMFNVPIPGGTTAHAVGGTLAAIVLGPWAAVVSVSVALVIQALFFGDGGITAIGANCFNMAIVLPFVGYAVYRLIASGSNPLSRRRLVAAGAGAYAGINAAGLLVGVELGVQPLLWSVDGRALYAPYPLSQAIPAMLLAHLTVAGAAEVIATVAALAYIQRSHPDLLERRTLTAASASPPAGPARPGWLLPVIALVVVLLVPLGLLAGGSAWGEWGGAELGGQLGYIPAGLSRYENLWRAPFAGYTMPWVSASAPFGEQALAYILSAVIGIGLIFVVVFAWRVLVKRNAGSAAPPATA
ncbi:MAG TPA: cobalt transporter CbiM [Thermomicrobiales bacterium]|nr:cobalt transporter CbiM [Thermomicrobiales bacterium]